MKIVGGLLSFIGFRERWVNNLGQRSPGRSNWIADLLEVEWLGFCVVLAIMGMRRA